MSRMKMSAAIYGGLLAVLLGGAWVNYTAEPALELDGKVILLQGEEAELEQLTWLSKNKDQAVMVKKSDAAGDYWQVTYTKWTEKKAPKVEPPPTEQPAPSAAEAPVGPSPDAPPAPAGEAPPPAADAATPPAEPAPEPTYEESVQVYKAGEEAGKLAKSLSPMLAIRKLTTLDAEKMETTGLDAPEEFLEITRKGKTIKLEVGGEVYGTRDRYVRDTSTQEVFLVDDELLRPLKYARTRLPDRTLWSIAPQDITKVAITGKDATVEVIQKNAQDVEKAAWVRADKPEELDEQLKTWMDKALKLKSTSYAEADDTFDGLELKFSMLITDKKGKTETFEVHAKADGTGDWWGKSEHTRGWVKLLKGPTSSLHEDVANLTSN